MILPMIYANSYTVSGRGALMWLDVVIASAANEGGNKWLRRGGEIAGFACTLSQAGGSHNSPRNCRFLTCFLDFPRFS